MRNRGKISYMTLNELSTLFDDDVEINQHIKTLNSNMNIEYINHHHAHAANGFLQSKFKE